ncbi:MAG: NAD-dependent epimerase/dehydratase family protein [Rhodothermia bacterium]
MKLVVTGGAGFIGSHISDALLSAGHEVHVIDNLSGGKLENVPSAAIFHEFDIRSEAAARLLMEEGFDAMIHHAAQMDVRKSVADPAFDADVNIIGFLSLMEATHKSGLRKVVFASTGGAIYGEPEFTPQDENHPVRPVSPYGIAKLATEKYLHFYRVAYGIEYVALRYGNVYGPRQNPHGEAGVVAIFAERMLKNEAVFVNGSGEQTRDYVYVADVVRANLAALAHEGSGIFNVGTGVETDVNHLFKQIRTLTGSPIPETHADAQPGEQMRSVLGCDLAASELEWRPTVLIDEGLSNTVNWFAGRINAPST